MRVLLVSANKEEINMPTLPWGLACVAAATQRAGHLVELVDLVSVADIRSALKRAIQGFHPDVIGLSVRNIDDQVMENPRFLLDQAREVMTHCRGLSDAPLILGGAGYSIFPESALAFVGADMGIQGEGEKAFPALLGRMERGEDPAGVPGLYLRGRGLQGRREFTQELDHLPLPGLGTWSAWHSREQDLWMPFQTRRGCPLNCSYCSTGAIEGRRIRKHSPERVIQALIGWVEAGFSRFFFVDNTFNLPPSYAKALCSGLATADLNLLWRAILYPLRLDEALVKEMARTGCQEVSVGFESGSERILRQMHKRFRREEVRQACAMLADYGIRRTGFLLLGGPGETKETVEESLSFADSLHLDAVKVTVGIRIYPNTALADAALADGLIAPRDELLFPRFYMVNGLERWLRETVSTWVAERPNWFT